MFRKIGDALRGKPAAKPAAHLSHTPVVAARSHGGPGGDRRPTYPKVFRYKVPEGVAQPNTVEVIGTFTDWRRVSLNFDSKTHSWHVNVPEIPGNKTHHYMLLVDGKPMQDVHCDGLAIPQGFQEEQYAITTARGPRVFMLFAQTK